jgi:hypothetical protein
VPAPKGTVINRRNLEDLGGFLGATGWSLIWGLNLGEGTAEQAAEEAQAVSAAIGTRLIAFEIGNEPDLFKPMRRSGGLHRALGRCGDLFQSVAGQSAGALDNLTSGIADYPWIRFFLWDVLGEVFGVVLFVALGATFSDRVQSLTELLGHLAWFIVGAAVAAVLGWKMFAYFRPVATT